MKTILNKIKQYGKRHKLISLHLDIHMDGYGALVSGFGDTRRVVFNFTGEDMLKLLLDDKKV